MQVLLWRAFALVLLCIVAPILVVIGLAIMLDSGRPIFFKQRRMGKNRKPFWIWKFRTMIGNADYTQHKYLSFNEADGPVFKIRNDPRYTRFGKWLSWSGLDELPQLINVLRGEMAFVGPRPLPVGEAEKIPRIYQKRFQVLPGITSSWVVSGAHNLSFKDWMRLDLKYLKEKSLRQDLVIVWRTLTMISRSIYNIMIKK